MIDLLPEQKDVTDLGATMRLGAQPCYIEPGTMAARAYGADVVEERHRHRWEVNPAYHEALVAGGMVISGSSQKGRLAEIVELPDHPFFIAGQFHPELRSRPTRPHPLFRDFVGRRDARIAPPASPRAPRPSRAEAVSEPAAARVAWAGRYLSVAIETWPGLGEYEVSASTTRSGSSRSPPTATSCSSNSSGRPCGPRCWRSPRVCWTSKGRTP